jgi:signal transduction histidine kinase
MILRFKRFFRDLKIYAALPEMRLFWLFLGLVLIILIIDFFYLPPLWQVISLAIFIGVGIIIFFNSFRTAKTNYSLKIEHQRLDHIIVNLSDGLISYDQDFKVLSINPAACQILNIRSEEVLNQYFSIEKGKDPKFKLLAYVLFPSLAPTVIRRSEAGIYPQIIDISSEEPGLELRISTSRVSDEKGNILGYYKTIQDRTREIGLLKSKMEFITIASHQLRTPLTGINWIFDSLKETPEIPQKLQELIKEGSQATDKLSKIVNDLLDVAKIEEGKFGYQFQEIDIVNFLEQLVNQAQLIAKEYKVKAYFKKPAEEKIVLTADPNKLSVALSNLIDNAIKYNIPNGEVIVAAEKVPNQPYIQIAVKDTGVGITKEDLNKLFTKFFRGENVMKIVTVGTGLGLYIAKNIIMRHGGKIWAESAINRGSTFYFTLPTDPKLIPPKEIIYEEY